MLNWDDLKYFLAIAEEGSLSAAAKKIRVSQPTLSRRLAAFEETVGADLFIRNRSGLDLTDLGEHLVEHARHMQDDVHAAERLITGHDSSLKGEVVISCIDIVGSGWMLQCARKLRKLYPGITIHIKIENQATDLLRREADIAIRMFRPIQNDLIAKKVTTMNYGYYVNREYIAEHGKPERFTDLKNHEYIMPDDMMIAHTDNRRTPPKRPSVTPAVRSNSIITMSNAVKAGLGIGACGCIVADDDPELVRLFNDMIVFGSDLWLVSHAELRRSARIRAVYDFLSKEFSIDSHKFSGERRPD